MERKTKKLKYQLFSLLIGIAIVPILIFYIGGGIIITKLSYEEEVRIIENISIIAEETSAVINKNPMYIEDYDKLTELIRPFIEERNGRVLIEDNDKNLVYDSSNREAIEKIIDLTTIYNTYEHDFNIPMFRVTGRIFSNEIRRTISNDNKSMFFQKSFEIFINNKSMSGQLFLDYNSEIQSLRSKSTKMLRDLKIVMYLGIILMIWLLSITLRNKILKPINELNNAAAKMIEGDYSYPLNYKDENEMNDLFIQFQNMRYDLGESRKKLINDGNARKLLIGNIAHDLRTPVTSIKGYVEGLIDGVPKNEVEQERYFNVIKDKADQLDFLINDLFAFSQLELGQLKINCNTVKKTELLKSFMREDKIISIKVDSKVFENEHLLLIDEKHIKRVFRNIIDNSIKFGATDISITAYVVNEFLRVNITDNGIGIAPKIKHHIFDRFFTRVPKEAIKAGGSGMGLAICKEIVNLHGGHIDVESTEGVGTTIYFTLPLK